jgi:hypothetical protein
MDRGRCPGWNEGKSFPLRRRSKHPRERVSARARDDLREYTHTRRYQNVSDLRINGRNDPWKGGNGPVA